MKKILTLLAAGLLSAGVLFAQERVAERTWLSTDKEVYVAGDMLWYSAFCLDAASGRLSPVSGIAYVELHSPDAVVCTGKVALQGGRGAGRLQLPLTVPTGNYRLVAYTAQNKAEEGYDYTGVASKTISVFNVFSTERVPDGVEVVDEQVYASLRSAARPVAAQSALTVRWNGEGLVLANAAGAASLSVSVYHDDGIVPDENPTLADFVAGCRTVQPGRFDNRILPEYEGEIIRGHVAGINPDSIPSLAGRYAFISSPSDKSDVYASAIDAEGRVAFFTGNICGDKECICEIEGIDPALNCFLELESPFVGARVAPVKPLKMTASLREALTARSFAMQVERRFTPDTLYDLLPVRDNGLFGSGEVVYPLDDYTRFPTMDEVLVEFVQELRARRGADRSREIQVRLADRTEPVFSRSKGLMMLDGVPVFDHQKILDYDPMLVESIHIYPQITFIGTRAFDGVANFVTYKRNMPSFRFGENVRVVDFQGASWPMASLGGALQEEAGYPDYRQTIYWHPQIELGAGASVELPCKLPDYKGRFVVVVEGLTLDGKPLRAETSFTTE